MNKKELTEADIRTKFITPALLGQAGSKWNVMTQLREELRFTRGRVIVRGKTVKRGEAKKADYVLYYKPGIPIAVVEAKDNNYGVGDGMQQALLPFWGEKPVVWDSDRASRRATVDDIRRPLVKRGLRPSHRTTPVVRGTGTTMGHTRPCDATLRPLGHRR